ncbi:DUF6807 family protein [Puniceicoccus vermicola]|uniref:PmoA family protein n=1 Tax=Puniceicoccus vermicola TaxID=388746 RepID=A0A7X1AWT1_9BACT|nr:DUF6807 family protein [Puniceicoccus vermicola]MBC2600255.1 PmoA family protein [Puniceicoccus vermicola]
MSSSTSHTRASLKFHPDDSVEFLWGDLPLFHYVARSEAPNEESPKPYFHPIRNLRGNVITNYRPNDHPWHHALSMTMTLVNGTNFWGGQYLPEGRRLPHAGKLRHTESPRLD